MSTQLLHRTCLVYVNELHNISVQVNHSGVLSSLLQYLTGLDPEADTEGRDEAEVQSESLASCEERLRLFLHVFADLPLDPE